MLSLRVMFWYTYVKGIYYSEKCKYLQIEGDTDEEDRRDDDKRDNGGEKYQSSGNDSSRGAIVDDFTMEMEIQISQYTELKDTMERCIEALHKKKDRAIELEEYHSQEKTKADTRYREALRKEEEERRRREEEERRRREEEWKRKMEELRKNMKVII